MTDPNLNRQLGPYRLDRIVGRGGMGTVYAARDEETGKRAAVKLLSPGLATDPAFRERFSSEIESLKKLSHANIVQLLGYGEQEGQLFYAMELIEGKSLQEELRHGRRFSWREVTQIAIEICAALKHAHDHGVIHRDLKPANLLYTSDDTIKLLDFGIAKLFGNAGVTTDSVMGTADYMAPEQAEGKAVGPRSDLYSLGSVMYALLAGRPPHTGSSVPEVVHKVRYESPVPITRLADDIPIELEQFIEQLLEKNPQKRVPTALAASHRLRAMLHALSVRPEEDERSPDDIDTSVVEAPQDDLTNAVSPSRDATVSMAEKDATEGLANDVTITTREPTSQTGPTHFVSVEKDRKRSASQQVRWQTLLRLLLSLAIATAAYQTWRYILRPPSADELYEKIERLGDASPSELAQVDATLEEFTTRFPDDPRQSEVANLQREVELYRLQRRLESRLRRQSSSPDSPLEQLYLEFLRLRRDDPGRAQRKLDALILLYADTATRDEQKSLLALARRQQAEIHQEMESEAEQHRPILESRLADAAKAAPADARQIYESVIQLYENRPWAARYVDQAKTQLDQLDQDHRDGGN